MGNQQVMNK